MSRFYKISCMVLAGLLLSGCAGRPTDKEAKAALQIENSQMESSQVKSSQMENSQTENSRVKSSQMEENQQEILLVKNNQGKKAGVNDGLVNNNQTAQMSKSNTENSHKKKIQTEGWRIQTECSKITDELAQAVYQEVLELNQEVYAGIYEIKNSRMVFLSEVSAQGETEVRAVFEADYTSIRNPRDCPLIQGMYEVKDELETDEEKQAADEYIDGWLKELNPGYQKTERISTEIVIKFEEEHPKEYKLYYPFVKNSKEKLKSLRKYAEKYWKEDREKMNQIGRAKLYEELEIEEN